MSDEKKRGQLPGEAPVDLSALDFGPSWAREASPGKPAEEKEATDARHRERRREGRRDERRQDREDSHREHRGRRDRERGPEKGRGHRDDRRGRHDDRRGRHDDRRGRGDDRRDDRREEVPPPEGVTAEIMPVEEGLDRLAKEILAGGRTYSVFDLARLVMGGRDRFNVVYRTDGASELYRCRKDGSVWLTQAEALRHFWRSSWRKEYYEEVVTDTKPPSGNFQAVARCGISGEYLGPPNYHAYQTALAQLHRERFSNMPLDLYKKKVRMEHGEEAVNAWLEKMSKRVSYRAVAAAAEEDAREAPDGSRSEAGEEERGAPEGVAEEEGEEGAADPVEMETTTSEPEAAPEMVDAAVEEGEEKAEAGDAKAPSEPLMVDRQEVERHFLDNGFSNAFQKCDWAAVAGNISGGLLSPGLLTLLRHTVSEERRYPGSLTPMLCRQLSGRHVAVFKWRRKLKAGPSRPHAVPSGMAMADRPGALLKWIIAKSGSSLEALWKEVLPGEAGEAEKRDWYRDLHWLINQGYVLLLSDSTLHLAKASSGGVQPARAPEGEGSASEAGGGKARQEGGGADGSPEARESGPESSGTADGAQGPVTETGEEPRVESGARKCSGLYAESGVTLRGVPKVSEGLDLRGLRPHPRFEEPPAEEAGEDAESERYSYW